MYKNALRQTCLSFYPRYKSPLFLLFIVSIRFFDSTNIVSYPIHSTLYVR